MYLKLKFMNNNRTENPDIILRGLESSMSFGMTSLSKNATGLGLPIFVYTKIPGHTWLSNRPFLRMIDTDDIIRAVWIERVTNLEALESNPLNTEQFIKTNIFINMNYEPLMQLWNCELTSDEFISKIVKI